MDISASNSYLHIFEYELIKSLGHLGNYIILKTALNLSSSSFTPSSAYFFRSPNCCMNYSWISQKQSVARKENILQLLLWCLAAATLAKENKSWGDCAAAIQSWCKSLHRLLDRTVIPRLQNKPTPLILPLIQNNFSSLHLSFSSPRVVIT